MRQFLGLCLIVSLLSIVGCKEKVITGTGPNIESLRSLTAFSKIEIYGNFNVSIVASHKEQSLRIVAQDNIIPYILTKVHKDTLVIEPKHSVKLSYKETPSIAITMPNLVSLNLSGSSKVTAAKIDNNSLLIKTHGHHEVILSGKTAALTIESSGDNEIHAENLQADDTKVTINGSSTVITNTVNHLDAKIDGYGRIGYTNMPKKISQEIHGSGFIKQVH